MTHTQATITYQHGWLYDGDHTTGGVEGAWTAAGAGASQAVSEGDFLALTRVGADASTVHATNLTLSTDVYTKILFRYKCSNANVKAGILVTFTVGTQEVLAATNAQNLTTTAVTLTAGKTINTVTLYATAAAGTVYYDFVLICGGQFTIPNSASGMDWEPKPRICHITIPRKDGDETQNFGTEPALWRITGDLTRGTWTRTGDHLVGEVFVEIACNNANEAWQWFNSGLGSCKVVLEDLRFHRECTGDKIYWTVSFTLKEKRVSSASCSHENYETRFQLLQV